MLKLFNPSMIKKKDYQQTSTDSLSKRKDLKINMIT